MRDGRARAMVRNAAISKVQNKSVCICACSNWRPSRRSSNIRASNALDSMQHLAVGHPVLLLLRPHRAGLDLRDRLVAVEAAGQQLRHILRQRQLAVLVRVRVLEVVLRPPPRGVQACGVALASPVRVILSFRRTLTNLMCSGCFRRDKYALAGGGLLEGATSNDLIQKVWH